MPRRGDPTNRFALRHPMRPTVMPANARILSTGDGHTWAEIYSPDVSAPVRWDVFDPAREWVGQVHAPREFRTLSVTGTKGAGVWYDDLGVEHVRVYRVRPD